MKKHHRLATASLALACWSAWGCSSDGIPAKKFASSPDAGTVCAPPFCLMLGDAAAPTTAGTTDPGPAKTGPGADPAAGPAAGPTAPTDKPKGGDKKDDPGVTMIGVPVGGTAPVTFLGGGSAGAAPMAPGCTPASALECPTKSGTCATSSSSNPTSVVQGVLCTYGGSFTVASGKPAAIVEYLHETAAGQNYYRFRITFDPSFVDNTYGDTAIGWGTKGHTWKDLLGSDHAELELFDNSHAMVAQLKIDYIGIDTAQTCGYSSLGVNGGDGKMLIGDSKWVLGSSSSLTRNLGGCGYCESSACGGDCRVNSPSTDEQWSSNSATPNWDYRVRYEVWVDAAAFGTSGFGGVNVSYVHASPSKQTNNTITVIPGPCPPPPDGCGPGTVEFLTSEGAATCVPVDSVPPNCGVTEEQMLTSEGAITCVPKNGNPPTTTTPPTTTPPTKTCVEGETTLVAKDGTIVCVPPDRCSEGFEPYLTSEGGLVECRPIKIIIQ
jgi:hypothetical protein